MEVFLYLLLFAAVIVLIIYFYRAWQKYKQHPEKHNPALKQLQQGREEADRLLDEKYAHERALRAEYDAKRHSVQIDPKEGRAIRVWVRGSFDTDCQKALKATSVDDGCLIYHQFNLTYPEATCVIVENYSIEPGNGFIGYLPKEVAEALIPVFGESWDTQGKVIEVQRNAKRELEARIEFYAPADFWY